MYSQFLHVDEKNNCYQIYWLATHHSSFKDSNRDVIHDGSFNTALKFLRQFKSKNRDVKILYHGKAQALKTGVTP